MPDSLLCTNRDFEQAYLRNVDTVFRVCFIYLKQSRADLEDAVQDTFLKLIKADKRFESLEHEKAWLIVTATNTCKNYLKSKWKRDVVLNDQLFSNRGSEDQFSDLDNNTVIQGVMDLPAKYKTIIYLYYYEGYKTEEIAKLLKKKPATVRNLLHRARGLLRNELEGIPYEY
ncbi:MAG: RNA polymerase sigma factor [Clostridiaceae bacterium]|jgi:RNA polymerase sigma-70 factor (ECF subfamily)|nr:RNA polymerase sigma factor [Clostridiaceae bacterium]